MLRMIKLTKINSETSGGVELNEDEIPRINSPVTETSPMMVNVEELREFYPRRNNKPGTRIVFKNGAGWPVTETFEQVESAINGVNN